MTRKKSDAKIGAMLRTDRERMRSSIWH